MLLLSQRCVGNTLSWLTDLSRGFYDSELKSHSGWECQGILTLNWWDHRATLPQIWYSSSESSRWALFAMAKDPFPGVKGAERRLSVWMGLNGGIIMHVNWDVDLRAFCEADTCVSWFVTLMAFVTFMNKTRSRYNQATEYLWIGLRVLTLIY